MDSAGESIGTLISVAESLAGVFSGVPLLGQIAGPIKDALG